MCGVVGLIGTADSAREAFLGLTTLQHRGQDASGILSYDDDGFHRIKNLGLVESVFNRDNMSLLTGNMAIGHVRYSTVGKGSTIEVQPFLLSYPFGIGMAHNGNIVNCAQLSKELRIGSRRHLLTHSDTEVILNMLADGLARAPANDELNFDHICEAVQDIFNRAVGSYSIVSIIADKGLLAFRDPHGLRPLIWGRRKNNTGEAHMLASESAPLSFLGYDVERNVQPGEVIFIDRDGRVHTRVLAQREKVPTSHCMFEWIYFASPDSILDGVPVYGARIQLGRNLASLVKEEMSRRGLTADLIVPIPETSRIAAIALAEELDIPYREVLIKNRYIKRTFILDSQEKRQKAVNLKLSPVRSEIAGKRILLVDDSIVRGTTSRKIVELVRQAGAEKVYIISTCPPIQYPCFYGIDFPSSKELIASGRNPDTMMHEIEQDIGADAVIYQDLVGLARSVNVPICKACIDGKYPTDVSAGESFSRNRSKDREAS
jgi:amidophosphoribosyltransferase